MKPPTLVVINFLENRARRYIPKPTGGFYTEEAKIGTAEEPAHTQSWGDRDGLRLIEEFRTGKVAPHIQQPHDQQEQA